MGNLFLGALIFAFGMLVGVGIYRVGEQNGEK